MGDRVLVDSYEHQARYDRITDQTGCPSVGRAHVDEQAGRIVHHRQVLRDLSEDDRTDRTRISVGLDHDGRPLFPPADPTGAGTEPGPHPRGSWLLRRIVVLVHVLPTRALPRLPGQGVEFVPCPWAIIV